MAVVVKNEGSSDFYFDDGTSRKKTVLSPGATTTISDLEFASVPISMRGTGNINVLYPDTSTSDSPKMNLDYSTFFGSAELLYLGVNRQEAADTDTDWVIKKFNYLQAADSTIKVSQIQVLDGAWTGRASLPWT